MTTRRFIPAYAGNILRIKRRGSNTAVHPRVCGEHNYYAASAASSSGSSPRMRGTLTSTHEKIGQNRFIPAYAGNMLFTHNARRGGTVHPRVCGEHRKPKTGDLPRYGSSPRMRGTYRTIKVYIAKTRFIPAYAGNILTQGQRAYILAVHPRVCGEHRTPSPTTVRQFGSSPRMRGT